LTIPYFTMTLFCYRAWWRRYNPSESQG